MEVLVHVLKVIDYLLIFNQFCKSPDVVDSILLNFALHNVGLITDQVCSIQHLEKTSFHLICIVVFARLESHFSERLGSNVQVKLEGKNMRQQSSDLNCLLRGEFAQIDVQMAKGHSIWTSLVHLAE